MPKLVPLHEFHERNGRLTEFSGYLLPLWFEGIITETLAVRSKAGLFDITHMGRIMVAGRDSVRLLEKVTTNAVSSLKVGQGHYSLICNHPGGIMDDIIIFRVGDETYMLVCNAANRLKVQDWLRINCTESEVRSEDLSDSVAMLALQGPQAGRILEQVSHVNVTDLDPFMCRWVEIDHMKVLVSRTGYTGEDGFEIFVWDSSLANPDRISFLWGELLKSGAEYGLKPCGLGARDVLRLEAGLCLYGADITEDINPFEAKLQFVVKMDKDFIGKESLQRVKSQGPRKIRIGLVGSKSIPRPGFRILQHGEEVGVLTSGTFSPTLKLGIGMGYVGTRVADSPSDLKIEVRGRLEEARLVSIPFYRRVRPEKAERDTEN